MTRKAILVGCDEYADGARFEPLACAREDVKQMRQVLSDPELGAFDTIEVFDRGESHTDVLERLEILSAEARSDDLLLLYFSGHAKVDPRDRLCLALRGTEMAKLRSTSLALSQIVDLLSTSRCRDVVVVLDCCYSGAARNSFELPPEWTGRGFTIIASSTDIQTSKAKEGESTSLFTKFFLEGLESGNADLDNDGVISANEAYAYAFNCVNGAGLAQTPMEFSIRQGAIQLARNRHHHPLPDSSQVPPSEIKRFLAIQNMIRLVTESAACQFAVVLLPHYFIEGEEYGASMLTVSQDHTPNMRQTADGFECDAFFPPRLLTDHAKAGKEAVNGVFKVRMEVKSENIMIIQGLVGGEQVNLFGL